jgi:type I restriction enzyme, S subunit
MIADLKPYPEYKESGLPWLGQVPGHWEMLRLHASITDCVTGVWGAEPNGEDDLICVRVADFDRVGLRVNGPIRAQK